MSDKWFKPLLQESALCVKTRLQHLTVFEAVEHRNAPGCILKQFKTQRLVATKVIIFNLAWTFFFFFSFPALRHSSHMGDLSNQNLLALYKVNFKTRSKLGLSC